MPRKNGPELFRGKGAGNGERIQTASPAGYIRQPSRLKHSETTLTLLAGGLKY
ncbi:hypothetical protein HMPREF3039_03110 [Akkermansia sp. KLE1798]|nr:hypothetical protein HMPREF3039_03110 [Akkermansia sp. KLE1798]